MKLDTGSSNPTVKEEQSVSAITEEVERLRKSLASRDDIIARLRELVQHCYEIVCAKDCKPQGF